VIIWDRHWFFSDPQDYLADISEGGASDGGNIAGSLKKSILVIGKKMSPDFCPGSFILLFEFLPGVENSLDSIANSHGYKQSDTSANGGLSAATTDGVTTNGVAT